MPLLSLNMRLEKITDRDLLKYGDRVLIEFKVRGFAVLQYAQLALIEARLAQKYPQYFIEAWDYSRMDTDGVVVARVLIKKPEAQTGPVRYEAGVSAGTVIAAITVIAGGLFLYLATGNIYKIVDSPTGAVVATTSSVGLIAVLALIGWFIFFRGK